MKSRSFGIGLGALTLEIVAVVAASGQGPLIPPAMYPVQGAPFTASIESVWEGSARVGPGRELTKVYRDNAGRQRFEFPAMEEATVTGQPVRIDIYDVVGEKIIRLDPQHKTANVSHIDRIGRPVTIDLSARSDVSRKASPGGEYLGMRSIAGLDAWGQHLVQTKVAPNGQSMTTARDLWVSTAYKMPLMEVREDALKGKLTQQVLRLDRGEPEASLFEVPAGYKVEGVPTNIVAAGSQ